MSLERFETPLVARLWCVWGIVSGAGSSYAVHTVGFSVVFVRMLI